MLCGTAEKTISDKEVNMTVKDFAYRTGYSVTYIRNACRRGKIVCNQWNGVYEIPKWQVPEWIAKRNTERIAAKGIKHSVTRYQRALDKYNLENDTCYSYGQAVCMNLLPEG